MSTEVSRKSVMRALAIIIVVGAALRICAACFDRPLIPDEYFQYLEPAWWHLTGAGIEAWEWHAGLRSWFLPFLNGAWMALWMGLGVHDGRVLGTLVRVYWAVINSTLVFVAWRGGCSLTRSLAREQAAPAGPSAPGGWQGGLLAAALCAGFGLLVVYGAHAISELPSMLCVLTGLVLTAELQERDKNDVTPAAIKKAAWAGVLLSLGACLRIANGPLTLLGPGWLLITGRYRALFTLLAATLVPALGFGLIDLFTWGSFAGSFVAYVKFNLIEGGAARFGTEERYFYLGRLWETLPWGLPLLGVAALCGARAGFPYLLSAIGLIAYLSREPHKEARFILAFWPYVLIAAAGSLGAWIARASAQRASDSVRQARWTRFVRGPRLSWLVSLLVVLVVLIDGTRNTHRDHWLEPDRVAAHAWLGRQKNITGALIDFPIYAGGGLWLNSLAPQIKFQPSLLANPLISHVVVRAGTFEEQASLMAGFAVLHHEGTMVILKRP